MPSTTARSTIPSALVAFLAALAIFPAIVSAHMEITYPAPFRSKNNPNVDEAHKDYSLNAPLLPDGSNFPCKGYHTDMTDDPNGVGASTADWAAGSQQQFTVDGGAVHGGGSCQASISYDNGASFKVMRSYIGNCPAGNGPTSFDFTVPADAPSGSALFAWTWFNQLGNREMYMNCAHVKISGGGAARRSPTARSMDQLVEIFKANINNDCTTVDSRDVEFPNPGSDVVHNPSALGSAPPVGGGCGASGPSNPAPPTEPTESTEPAEPTEPVEPAPPGESPTSSQLSSSDSSGVPSTSDGATPPSSAGTPPAPTDTADVVNKSSKTCVRRKKRGHVAGNLRRHAGAGPARGTF